MNYISFENCCELIRESKAGYIILKAAIEGVPLLYFPKSDDNESEVNDNKKSLSTGTNEVILKLSSVLEKLGSGKYKVVVRSNSKGVGNEVIIWFIYESSETTTPKQTVDNPLGSIQAVKSEIEAQVLSGVEKFKQEWLKEQAYLKEIDDLKKQLAEKNKPTQKAAKTGFDAKTAQVILGGLGAAGLPFIKMKYPDAYNDVKEVLNKVVDFDLNALDDEEEEEEDFTEHEDVTEPKPKFTRPETE